MIDLAVEIGTIRMSNPAMLASGVMDETGEALVRMMEAGAGAVVTKSIGVAAHDGHPNPCLVELPHGYVNAMGLPNPGMDRFAEELRTIMPAPAPVIASVYAADEEGFVAVAAAMEDAGAAGVEMNLSCPHAAGFGMELGTDPARVRSMVEAVASSVSVPVMAKLTPNTADITAIGRAVEDGGGDAVVAINTLRAMCISPEFARPVLSNRYGGLSGPAVRPVGVRAVYDLRRELSIPIVGVGGIETWRDAAEYIMAGASCFQVGSAVGRRGPEVFREITGGLQAFMESHGYAGMKDMEAAAHD